MRIKIGKITINIFLPPMPKKQLRDRGGVWLIALWGLIVTIFNKLLDRLGDLLIDDYIIPILNHLTDTLT